VKIDAHSYKAFRESIWGDRLIKLINLIFRSTECGLDEKVRNSIEGKFGVGKRSFRLELVMTLLSETSLTAIAITFKIMNLSTFLKEVKS